MKFIGGPAHGHDLPAWMLRKAPTRVQVDATVDGQHLDRKAMLAPVADNKRAHPYYRTTYWRGQFFFYASAGLTTAEIDNLAKRAFR